VAAGSRRLLLQAGPSCRRPRRRAGASPALGRHVGDLRCPRSGRTAHFSFGSGGVAGHSRAGRGGVARGGCGGRLRSVPVEGGQTDGQSGRGWLWAIVHVRIAADGGGRGWLAARLPIGWGPYPGRSGISRQHPKPLKAGFRKLNPAYSMTPNWHGAEYLHSVAAWPQAVSKRCPTPSGESRRPTAALTEALLSSAGTRFPLQRGGRQKAVNNPGVFHVFVVKPGKEHNCPIQVVG
jgi:hypothetical protein